MTEQIGKLIEQYWVVIAAVVLYFMSPDKAKVLLSKIGVVKNPEGEPVDDLDLVNELARANAAGGYGAEEEIQGIFKKFTAGKVK